MIPKIHVDIENTYTNTKMIHNGIRMISENEARRKMFLVWNSTIDISRRAPHQEFWPNDWNKANHKIQYSHIRELLIKELLTSNSVSE